MSEKESAVLLAARALSRELPRRSAEIEKARRLPADLVEALSSAGLLRLSVPRSVGGGEVALSTQLRVIEALATGDASVGWCVMIASTTALVGGYLDDANLKEIFGDPTGASCGVYAPKGMAMAAPGGFKVTGTWSFGSGCEHSTWRLGGAILLGDDGPKMLPNGMPEFRLMLFPAKDSQVVDTWDVSGMKGTGSHDISVEDLFVPAGHSVSPMTDKVRQSGALYRFPLFGFLAAEVAAVGLGIGRAAIDAFRALAVEKVPFGARRSIAQRSVVQAQFASAEAQVAAARAFLFETVASLQEAADKGDELTVAQRARLRLAATHAATASAAAVDLMYGAGGASSIYASNPLQRHFRDVHVVTQHAMVAPAMNELVGRQLLGLEIDPVQL